MAANNGRRGALRRLAAYAAAGAAAALASRAGAQSGPAYRDIPPQPAPDGGLIEVVEFFWYGCPYCDSLQPHFQAWWQRQPADIVVRRVPAVFRPSWIAHARLYYTLQALDAVERLHQQVYDSYHRERMPLDDADAIADWARRHGMERERWLSVYRSDGIDREIAQARDQLLDYTVSGTPSLVVDGRYLTSSGMTPGVAAMIPVIEQLITRVREQRAGR